MIRETSPKRFQNGQDLLVSKELKQHYCKGLKGFVKFYSRIPSGSFDWQLLSSRLIGNFLILFFRKEFREAQLQKLHSVDRIAIEIRRLFSTPPQHHDMFEESPVGLFVFVCVRTKKRLLLKQGMLGGRYAQRIRRHSLIYRRNPHRRSQEREHAGVGRSVGWKFVRSFVRLIVWLAVGAEMTLSKEVIAHHFDEFWQLWPERRTDGERR